MQGTALFMAVLSRPTYRSCDTRVAATVGVAVQLYELLITVKTRDASTRRIPRALIPLPGATGTRALLMSSFERMEHGKR